MVVVEADCFLWKTTFFLYESMTWTMLTGVWEWVSRLRCKLGQVFCRQKCVDNLAILPNVFTDLCFDFLDELMSFFAPLAQQVFSALTRYTGSVYSY